MLDVFDRQSLIEASQSISSIFCNDVCVMLFDPHWALLFDHASSVKFAEEQKSRVSSIVESIRMGENAIRQLNSGWRIEELKSFRLMCHLSRIFAFLINDSFHLIVINKFTNRESRIDPTFEKSLAEACNRVKVSISALSNAHVQ